MLLGFTELQLAELHAELAGIDADAAVVRVDDPARLTEIAELRKSRLDLPIVALSPRDDRDFLDLADDAGATRVVGSVAAAAAALKSPTLLRDLKRQTRWTLSQPKPVRIRAAGRPGKFRPLLVDDDPDHGFFMKRAFRKAHLPEPLPVLKTGEDLVRHLTTASEPPPSLVILDEHLPGQSGLDVLRWIRERSPHRSLPVVLLSSDANPDLASNAYEFGANCALVKPTRFEELVELVKGLKFYWG